MSRNSQHICAPLPPPPSIPIIRSRPVLRHLPQRPALPGCLGSSAPPPLFLSFLFSFLRLLFFSIAFFFFFLPANIFHHRDCKPRCFEKSTVCSWSGVSPLDGRERCRCACVCVYVCVCVCAQFGTFPWFLTGFSEYRMSPQSCTCGPQDQIRTREGCTPCLQEEDPGHVGSEGVM